MLLRRLPVRYSIPLPARLTLVPNAERQSHQVVMHSKYVHTHHKSYPLPNPNAETKNGKIRAPCKNSRRLLARHNARKPPLTRHTRIHHPRQRNRLLIIHALPPHPYSKHPIQHLLFPAPQARRDPPVESRPAGLHAPDRQLLVAEFAGAAVQDGLEARVVWDREGAHHPPVVAREESPGADRGGVNGGRLDRHVPARLGTPCALAWAPSSPSCRHLSLGVWARSSSCR